MEQIIQYRVSGGDLTVKAHPQNKSVSVRLSASQSRAGEETIDYDVEKDSILSTFMSNYECWNNDTNAMSTNNYDNPNFKAIVDMGESVVPQIYDIIKNSAHPIVYALDLIYPGYMTYKGNVSLKEVCQAWISILQILGKV